MTLGFSHVLSSASICRGESWEKLEADVTLTLLLEANGSLPECCMPDFFILAQGEGVVRVQGLLALALAW